MIIPRVVIVPELTSDGRDLLVDAGGLVDFDYPAWVHRLTMPPSLESAAMGFCHAGTTVCYALTPGKHLHVTPGRAFSANVPKQDQPVLCSDMSWFHRNLVVLPQCCVWTVPGAFSEQRYQDSWQFEVVPGLHTIPDVQEKLELRRATLVRPSDQSAPGQHVDSYWSSDPSIVCVRDRAAFISESEMTMVSLAAKCGDFVITWRDWDGEWYGCCYSLDGKMFLPDSADSAQRAVTGKSREEVEERLLGKEGVQLILGQWLGE